MDACTDCGHTPLDHQNEDGEGCRVRDDDGRCHCPRHITPSTTHHEHEESPAMGASTEIHLEAAAEAAAKALYIHDTKARFPDTDGLTADDWAEVWELDVEPAEKHAYRERGLAAVHATHRDIARQGWEHGKTAGASCNEGWEDTLTNPYTVEEH